MNFMNNLKVAYKLLILVIVAVLAMITLGTEATTQSSHRRMT